MTSSIVRKILDATQDIENVYFDCFDTLIKRKYSPNYCFYKCSDMLIMEYSFPYNHTELSSSLSHFFLQCDIDFSKAVYNIYLHYNELLLNIPFETFLPKFREAFISAEMNNIELEDNAAYLLKKLENKKLHLLSDYFLDKEVVKEFFITLLGYNPFSEIIISCDYFASKESGSLYYNVVNPTSSIMIGDNKTNDYINSQKFGMKAIWINSFNNYERYRRFDENYHKNIQQELFRLRSKKTKTYASNFAFSLYLFCKKLYSKLEENDTVWFLARDGFFMKLCFDQFLAFSNHKHIHTRYLETSRLALLLPSLKDTELTAEIIKDKFSTRTQWKISTGSDFLRVLGFSENQISDFHLSTEKKDNYFQSDEYNNLFQNPKFISELKIRCSDAKKKFEAITQSVGKRFITVDLGWQGTAQNDMRKILNSETDLIGYYLGTTRCIGELQNSYKIGVLFDYGSISKSLEQHYYDIEGLLKTNKGQLISYSMNEDIYVEDNGVLVFNIYSEKCQNEAFLILKKLCEIDQLTPIFFEDIDVVIREIYSHKSTLSIMWGNFFYNLQNSNCSNIKPTMKNYLFAIKLKVSERFPYIYNFIKKIYFLTEYYRTNILE